MAWSTTSSQSRSIINFFVYSLWKFRWHAVNRERLGITNYSLKVHFNCSERARARNYELFIYPFRSGYYLLLRWIIVVFISVWVASSRANRNRNRLRRKKKKNSEKTHYYSNLRCLSSHSKCLISSFVSTASRGAAIDSRILRAQ